jgi:hypothetical protein
MIVGLDTEEPRLLLERTGSSADSNYSILDRIVAPPGGHHLHTT